MAKDPTVRGLYRNGIRGKGGEKEGLSRAQCPCKWGYGENRGRGGRSSSRRDVGFVGKGQRE